MKDRQGFTDGFLGTYDSDLSKGVYHFFYNTEDGSLTEPELFYEAQNAKWVSLNGSTMVFPIEKQGRAGVCFLELEKDGASYSHAAEILQERQTPCYILHDGAFVYTANYHEGNVMVYQLTEGHPVLINRIENGKGAGCHQILLHETCLLVPCLMQDSIRLFDRFHGFAPAGEIKFPNGSGPRHGVFNRDHTKFYVVSELSNELFVFRVQGMEFHLGQRLSILPDNRDGAAAAIRLTADGSFLYISIRGINQLVTLDVREDTAAVIQYSSSGGDHPRDFVLSKDERYLIVANRLDGEVVCMERDGVTGMLKAPLHRRSMPEGVSLVLNEA